MLFSSRKAFVSKLLASIGSIDSFSTVFAFESIKSYDNLDITNLMELDVHIPNSRSIDYTNTFDLSFLELFEKEYGTNIRKYTYFWYALFRYLPVSTPPIYPHSGDLKALQTHVNSRLMPNSTDEQVKVAIIKSVDSNSDSWKSSISDLSHGVKTSLQGLFFNLEL